MRTLLSIRHAGRRELGTISPGCWAATRRRAPAPAKSCAAQGRARSAAEKLTERELEIVGMLSRVLTNKKIARALGISDGTVKWHMKNINSKLGVISRDEALARCRDLGLIGLILRRPLVLAASWRSTKSRTHASA